jgi:hypothetical protein
VSDLARLAAQLLTLGLLLSAIGSILWAMYNMFLLLTNVEEGKRPLFRLLGPLALLTDSCFTEVGNRARVRLVISLPIIGILFASLALMDSILHG